MENHNHFQVISHKLDLQREELKENIDKIYFTVNPRPVAHGVVRIPQWASPGSDSRHNY